MRLPLTLGVGLLSIAGTCRRSENTAIALRPASAMNADSVRHAALELAERVAARFALRPTGPKAARIRECFERGHVALCTKALDEEAQFYIVDESGPRLGPLADSLRRQLLDSLQ